MPRARDELLALSDEALLRHCRCEAARGTGPGGQHRNTRDTAVRLVLEPRPEVTAQATERRSQHLNRRRALRRLRLALALDWRCDAPPRWSGPWDAAAGKPTYARLVAVVLDALAQQDYAVGAAARALGRSTAELSRVICRDKRVLAHVNQTRAERGLKPLKPRT